MLTDQDRKFGIHFLRNRRARISGAAPSTTTAAPPTSSGPAAAGPPYGFDDQIGRLAFLGRHDGFRSRHAALRGLELIRCLDFVQQRREARWSIIGTKAAVFCLPLLTFVHKMLAEFTTPFSTSA